MIRGASLDAYTAKFNIHQPPSYGMRKNRLVAVTKANNTVIYFSYDAQSSRITKQVGSGGTEIFVYDGWSLASEYNCKLPQK